VSRLLNVASCVVLVLMQPIWRGASATLLGTWSSLVYDGASSPVCSLAGDILSILQAVVVHVKLVSLICPDSSSFGWLALHCVTEL
jgi:hypothetical protein